MNERPKIYLRMLVIMCLDCLAVFCAGGVALLLRFDLSFAAVPQFYKDIWLGFLPAQLAIMAGVFSCGRCITMFGGRSVFRTSAT